MEASRADTCRGWLQARKRGLCVRFFIILLFAQLISELQLLCFVSKSHTSRHAPTAFGMLFGPHMRGKHWPTDSIGARSPQAEVDVFFIVFYLYRSSDPALAAARLDPVAQIMSPQSVSGAQRNATSSFLNDSANVTTALNARQILTGEIRKAVRSLSLTVSDPAT